MRIKFNPAIAFAVETVQVEYEPLKKLVLSFVLNQAH